MVTSISGRASARNEEWPFATERLPKMLTPGEFVREGMLFWESMVSAIDRLEVKTSTGNSYFAPKADLVSARKRLQPVTRPTTTGGDS